MNFSDDGGYRGGRRENGHAVLLLEANEGEKTFSDYPDQATCLTTIVNMYEEYREACCERSEGDLKEFWNWLNDFFRIEMFVYDKDIARYRQTSRERLKQLFEEKDDNACRPKQNGKKMTNGFCGSNGSSNGDEDEEIGDQALDDEENWDD